MNPRSTNPNVELCEFNVELCEFNVELCEFNDIANAKGPRLKLWGAVVAAVLAVAGLAVSVRYSVSLLGEGDEGDTSPPVQREAPSPSPEVRQEILDLERAVAAAPEDDDLWLQLAEAYLDARQAKKASDLLGRRQSDRPEAVLFRGLASMALGDTQAAERHLQEAQKRMPESPRPGVALYYLYDTSGRTAEAVRTAEETFEAHPDDYDVQLIHAEQLLKRGVDGRAKDVLTQAIADHADFAEAYALMARASMVDHTEALRYAQEALERDPECLLALLAVGRVYASQPGEPGSLDKAEQALLKAAASHPDQPGPHFRLGVLYRRVGRTQEAVERLETAVRLSPDTLSSITALAGVYDELGRHDEAAAIRTVIRERSYFTNATSDLRRILEYEPKNLEARIDLAELYQRHERHATALAFAEEALALDPGNSRAVEVLREAQVSLSERPSTEGR